MKMRHRSLSIGWRRVVALFLAVSCSLLAGCTGSRKATSNGEMFFEPVKTTNQSPESKPFQIEEAGTRAAWDKKADSLLIHQKNQEQRIKALSEQLLLLESARQGVRADSSRVTNNQPTRVSKPVVRDDRAAPLTYEEALRHYEAGSYQKAVDEFQELLRRGVQENEEDEYHLLIGVSRYHLNQPDLATASLRRVIDAPQAKKKADAYYVLGLVLIRLGDNPQARIMFESVLKEFPGSDLAAAARKKLSGLPAVK